MVAGGTDSQGTAEKRVHEMRARCERCRGLLHELALIHLTIDASTRQMQADEPDWIGHLWKVCLHVKAIDGWEIGAGVEHVMATELRAAYHHSSSVPSDGCRMEACARDDPAGRDGWWVLGR